MNVKQNKSDDSNSNSHSVLETNTTKHTTSHTNIDVLVVVGTRPQFVKLAVLLKYFRKHGINFGVVHTGQHYDYEMNKIFFEDLEIPTPVKHLNVGSGTHGKQTALMLERLEDTYQEFHPQCVVVPGDTNSALAGALAAVKLHIHTFHVEAGLRSRLQFMAEEINRVLIDHMSTLLFAPTQTAYDNLLAEGIATDKVHLTGDVMIDNIVFYADRIEKTELPFTVTPNQYIYTTIHRAENVDFPEKLREILDAIKLVAQKYDLDVIIPLHPRTKKRLLSYGMFSDFVASPGIRVIEPVGYFQSLKLAKHAKLVITDSGGLQKEAFALGTPVVTMRETTEWVEIVDAGWNIITDYKKTRILDAVTHFMEKKLPQVNALEFYGSGTASERITSLIEDFLGGNIP